VSANLLLVPKDRDRHQDYRNDPQNDVFTAIFFFGHSQTVQHNSISSSSVFAESLSPEARQSACFAGNVHSLALRDSGPQKTQSASAQLSRRKSSGQLSRVPYGYRLGYLPDASPNV
jgi:hypothetical protein